jgi:hypothetical protein
MWGALQHPRHAEWYEEFHAKRQSHDEDWLPMARAVRHFQSLAVAPQLFAFTSLWRFHLTTAPSYHDCDRHCSVTVIWRWPDRVFHIAFGRLADGWVDDRPPEQICDESALPGVIEPFIQRLLASSSESDTHDG